MPATPKSYWTVAVENGAEKTVEDWEIETDSFRRQKRAGAVSTLTFKIVPEDFAADPPFTTDDVLTFWRARQFVGTELKNGVRWFYGQVQSVRPNREENGFEFWYLEVADIWRMLENATFKQPMYSWTGELDGNGHALPNFAVKYVTDVLIPWRRGVSQSNFITTEDQIKDVIAWANTNIVPPIPLQAGTIALAPGGFSGGTVPLSQLRNAKCSKVIEAMLNWSPDAVAWIDDSTTPSTFNAKRWVDLPTVTLALGPTVQLLDGVDLEALDRMIPDSVQFFFRKFNEVTNNGQTFTYPYFTDQLWPPGKTGNERRAVHDTFDLQGSQKTILKSDVTVQPLNHNSANAADQVAWWKEHCNILEDPRKSNIVISDVQVLVDGVPFVGPLYANELVDGEITDWMTDVDYIEVEIVCHATFKQWNDDAQTSLLYDLAAQNNPVRFTTGKGVIITNATTGTYSTSRYTQQQEPEPLNFARWFFENASVRHWAGKLKITDPEIIDRVAIGQCVNLTGGHVDWTTMHAMITAIDDDVGTGATYVTLGPPKFIGAHDLLDYLKFNRLQGIRTTSAYTAQTGQVGAGSSISQSGMRASWNSMSGFTGGGGDDGFWE